MQYLYLGRLKGERHKGIVCIGYEVDDPLTKYSIALCSPRDEFNKKLARRMVDGRLHSTRCPIRYRFICTGDRKKIWQELIKDLNHCISIDRIPGVGKAPNWLKPITLTT